MSSTVRRTEAPRVERRSVRSTASGGAKSSQLLSGVPAGGAFYIYSFDGRLLAEYNILGGCVRDYVYFGGQLIAEYQTTGEDLYYYTSDQINSTRIVTDSTGTVVYAAAHDPYGRIQKTWVNSYDPSLKFSGKQHDEESELDYFGARYYDRAQYRFISVDPVINKRAAISDPQSSNLYAYCRNNPVKYLDPDGLSYIIFCKYDSKLYVFTGDGTLMGAFPAHNDVDTGKQPFPTGVRLKFSHWNWEDHVGKPDDASIDSWGAICFFTDLNKDGKLERDMAIHAGGKYGLKTWTNGCIRTTQEAMFLLWVLEYGGDKIEYLLVTDYYTGVEDGGPNPIAEEELKKLYLQYVEWVLGMASYFNMINDYFFWYGPIPPGAQ